MYLMIRIYILQGPSGLFSPSESLLEKGKPAFRPRSPLDTYQRVISLTNGWAPSDALLSTALRARPLARESEFNFLTLQAGLRRLSLQ